MSTPPPSVVWDFMQPDVSFLNRQKNLKSFKSKHSILSNWKQHINVLLFLRKVTLTFRILSSQQFFFFFLSCAVLSFKWFSAVFTKYTAVSQRTESYCEHDTSNLCLVIFFPSCLVKHLHFGNFKYPSCSATANARLLCKIIKLSTFSAYKLCSSVFFILNEH